MMGRFGVGSDRVVLSMASAPLWLVSKDKRGWRAVADRVAGSARWSEDRGGGIERDSSQHL